MSGPILILGGTAIARTLADEAADAGRDVVLSLAGRTAMPAATRAKLRVGGFGGVEGLRAYLRENRIARVLDATHPFAARMSANAHAACAAENVPRLAMLRAPWIDGPGDRWTRVADMTEAAARLPALGRRVFVAFADGLAPLAATGLAFVVRRIEPGDPGLPGAELVLGRGPFACADEIALFRAKAIDAVLAKDSGGMEARAKLDAARALGLPAMLIRRPTPPAGPATESRGEALIWLGLDAVTAASV
ncbi:MAG: cobalt-precorrin-6A reductase [Tagaea sp.]|nr:cobalt-precorrin-6A reductase [Tagaea sp.]